MYPFAIDAHQTAFRLILKSRRQPASETCSRLPWSFLSWPPSCDPLQTSVCSLVPRRGRRDWRTGKTGKIGPRSKPFSPAAPSRHKMPKRIFDDATGAPVIVHLHTRRLDCSSWKLLCLKIQSRGRQTFRQEDCIQKNISVWGINISLRVIELRKKNGSYKSVLESFKGKLLC
jgi:hypothetical protein